MSDLYLQRIDKHKTFRELEEIARHAIRSFCEKVAECKDKELGKYSPRIQKAIKYIRTHLHYPISLAEVASYTEISPKYLSSNDKNLLLTNKDSLPIPVFYRHYCAPHVLGSHSNQKNSSAFHRILSDYG